MSALLGPVLIAMVVLGAVLLAFTQGAVAELALKLAVWLWSPERGVRVDRLEEWTAELHAMKPRERPAHAGSLLWEGVLRSSSRLSNRVVNVPSRRRSSGPPVLNPYSLFRDADIVAIGHDGAEVPVHWDPETDSLSFLTGYVSLDTGAWVLHTPPMELGDDITFLFEIKVGSPPITPHSVRIHALPDDLARAVQEKSSHSRKSRASGGRSSRW